MVRTKADSGGAATRKVVAARAPRKSLGSSTSTASSSSSGSGASPAGKKYAGGNPVCPRPTPDWQKGIGSFLVKKPDDKENEEPEQQEAGCSGSSSSAGECNAGPSSSASCSGNSKTDDAGPSEVAMADEEEEDGDS